MLPKILEMYKLFYIASKRANKQQQENLTRTLLRKRAIICMYSHLVSSFGEPKQWDHRLYIDFDCIQQAVAAGRCPVRALKTAKCVSDRVLTKI